MEAVLREAHLPDVGIDSAAAQHPMAAIECPRVLHILAQACWHTYTRMQSLSTKTVHLPGLASASPNTHGTHANAHGCTRVYSIHMPVPCMDGVQPESQLCDASFDV